jgi:glutamate racemase
MKYEPDIILIACNTLSVIYNETEISKRIKIPVIGIVENGVEMILDSVKNDTSYGVIVLGTETTISSNQHKIRLVENGIPANKIITQACKNLESEIQNDPKSPIVSQQIEKYLLESKDKLIEKSAKQFILLACTHYGYSKYIFRQICEKIFGTNFEILNPNERMAKLLSGKNETINKGKSKITNRVLSRVKLKEEQIENLGRLLKLDSEATAEALLKYEYLPELFFFDEDDITLER